MADAGNDRQILRPGQMIRPKVDVETAVALVRRLYGLKAKVVRELNAYDDKNFHVLCEDEPPIAELHGEGYVLKITNSLDSRDILYVEGQTALLTFLNDNRINVPRPVKNLNEGYFSLEIFEGGSEAHVVRLLTYKPGVTLLNVEISDELLFDVGNLAGRLDEVLKNFVHPAYEEHSTVWMLSSVPSLREFAYAVEDAGKRRLVYEVIEKFEDVVMRNLDRLEEGIIHGDLNEQNLLVDEDEGKKLVAVLDVGDSQKSFLIFELAIAMCYMLLRVDDIARGKHVLEGYEKIRRLPDFEEKILKLCVCARLCQSLVLGVYSHRNDPDNDYVLGTQTRGWILLDELWSIADEKMMKIWR